MTIPIIDANNFIEQLKVQKNPFFDEYYALYSSWYKGIVINPLLMLIPIDDHMVHRGDGVFEGIKAVGRMVYLLKEHLERLFVSAEKIGIKHSFSLEKISEIIIETLQVANQNDAMIRIFISRGPGNFSVNPYDAIEPQLYVIVHRLSTIPIKKYQDGVIVGKSEINFKASWLTKIKTCNYLPNVIMKKEAVDRKLDYVIGIDKEGNLTEGATENILIVDQLGTIVHSGLDNILQGITLMRISELAKQNGFKIEMKSISTEDVYSAREVMVAGTTIDVLPVVKFEGKLIGNGKPGPIAKKLHELMLNDIKMGSKRTVF